MSFDVELRSPSGNFDVILSMATANMNLLVGGAFKQVTNGYVLVNGVWKEIIEIDVLVDGVWKIV